MKGSEKSISCCDTRGHEIALSTNGVKSKDSCSTTHGHNHGHIHASIEEDIGGDSPHGPDHRGLHGSKADSPCCPSKYHDNVHAGSDHRHDHGHVSMSKTKDPCCSSNCEDQLHAVTNHDHGHMHAASIRTNDANGTCCSGKGSVGEAVASIRTNYVDGTCCSGIGSVREAAAMGLDCCGAEKEIFHVNNDDLNDSDCCDDSSCQNNRHGDTVGNFDCCDDDDCHAKTSKVSSIESKCAKTLTSEEGHKIEVVVQEIKDICDLICDACDPNSKIPHSLQISRFRVANLCCAGEENIIRTCLGTLTGIESVAVNVIGRYIIVKHCAVSCCAPAEKIVDELNSKHLGVSIQEVGDNKNDDDEKLDYLRITHVAVVFILFVLGLLFQFIHSETVISIGLFLSSAALGLLPILYKSYVTILRKTVDINILMVIAVAGAIGGKEYFDASLVVTLFIIAELVESVAMMKVRQAVNSGSTSMAKEAYLSNGQKIKVEDLKIGNVLAVRAGEMILGLIFFLLNRSLTISDIILFLMNLFLII